MQAAVLLGYVHDLDQEMAGPDNSWRLVTRGKLGELLEHRPLFVFRNALSLARHC